jgi:hypothetical protein
MRSHRSVSQGGTRSCGGFRRISVANRLVVLRYPAVMMPRRPVIVRVVLFVVAVLPVVAIAQTDERTQYARIAVLHPRDGHTVDFEAGYIRHLAFHQQAKDSWVWYGWTIWAGERQRWFVYATFGHSAASLDSPVAPAEDERDNILNVAPHVDSWGNALYEYLPRLSRGTGAPTPTAGSSSRRSISNQGPRQHSRQRFARPAPPSRPRRSGIGWLRVESRRAMSDCVRARACQRFSMRRVSRHSLRRSTL